MPNEELKARIQAYVSEYMAKKGYAPSYREIQYAAGVRSTSTVYEYVKRLEAEGRLSMRGSHSRTIADSRKVPVEPNTARRIRVDVADGGVLFLDCSFEDRNDGELQFEISGVLDASRLKGAIGNVIGCSIENEE